MAFKRISSVDSVKVIQVIEVRSLIGSGTEDDPTQLLIEYWSMEGVLLARVKDGITNFLYNCTAINDEQPAPWPTAPTAPKP